jgi:hypothetical protein
MQKHNLQTKKKMKRFFFFFIYLVLNEATKGKCRQAQNQEKKQNSGLKRRSQRIRAKTHNGNQESKDSYACLKTIKQNFSFFFFIFSINYQLRKNRLRVRGPNLLTVQP